MHISNKQPVVARDEYVFRLDVAMDLSFGVDLGNSTKNQKNQPLFLDLAHQMWQPMNLLSKVVTDVLTQKHRPLLNFGRTGLVIKQNIWMTSFRLKVFLFLFHLVLQALEILIECNLFEGFKHDGTLVLVRE